MSNHSDLVIAGAGGGGGGKGGGSGSRTPVESPDSLRSRQYARVLDAICEGPIVGLVNGLKSIYLNDVPLQNTDGSYNFTNVTVQTALGTQIQAYIPGFGDPQATTAVSVEVKAAVPVVQTISAGSNFDAIQLTLGFPSLTLQNKTNGDLGGTGVDIAIDLQTNGGGFVQVLADTITGKTTTRYQRAYRIALTGTGPWDIRVRRITPDSIDSTLQNKSFWDLYIGLVDSKLRYPNTALVGVQVDAAQFNAIPKRSYDVKMLQISIPSNYNPLTRIYTGVWDGSFVTAWSDNPAWCFYDLLTNTRYGLGEFVQPAQVDKWALYSIAQYCDGLVSDGFGGTEPRFTCNIYIQTQAEAYTLLGNFAALFRAISYWGSGTIHTVQDAPKTAIAQFTNASVLDGEFSYSGSSRRGRHTVVLVSWNDPKDNYRQKIEYVSDDAGIARYGVQQTSIVAMGCASRGQAHRLGQWMLLSEINEQEVVTFTAALDGSSLFPGAIIKTIDRHRAGVRYGGRVVSATLTSVTLDAPVTLSSGISYHVTLVLPDGTLSEQPVSTAPSTTAVLTWGTALAALPQAYSVWLLAADNVNPEIWRVVGLSEKDSTQVIVTALAQDVNKFLQVETGLVLQPLPTTLISITQSAVGNISISEALYIKADSLINRITVAWDAAPGATRYIVEYRKDSGNWIALPDVTRQSVDVDAEPGQYSARITAINAVGTRSIVSLFGPVAILGKTALPPDVNVFLINTQADGTRQLSWVLNTPPLDLAGFKIRYFLGATSSWDAMADLYSGILNVSPFETNQLAAGSYTFAIKAIDTTNNVSANAKFISATLGDPRLKNVLVQRQERVLGWPGTITGGFIYNGSVLSVSSTTIAGLPATISVLSGAIDTIGTNTSPLVYATPVIDLGVNTTFTPLVTVAGQGTQTLLMKTGASADGGVVGLWVPLALVTGKRYVQIQVNLADTAPRIDEIVTLLNGDVQEDVFNDVNTATETALWFFRVGVGNFRIGSKSGKIAAITTATILALQNTGGAWTWELVNKTSTVNGQPAAEFKIRNAAGALADAVIDVSLKGAKT
ncbi:host specificity protein J [Sulfuriferula sp.]|uniref:host specificity protein J n=1 Tax=Sulfuriferula sp. TaxID=2025307 RepID=UPI002730E942|nr:phage tail protein [Sulfuriferula sp.]MDP2026457.1 phage tail protein [Sulfuriferula sp.]